ncbi:hypothetical protein [Lutispora thermophila]|uniref:hypothetical protein n=1 Tax=Lutispora thermophila TaxID=288966 RepID=UPI0011148BED|nr:hypothetical protein [Lutispora thermophila]
MSSVPHRQKRVSGGRKQKGSRALALWVKTMEDGKNLEYTIEESLGVREVYVLKVWFGTGETIICTVQREPEESIVLMKLQMDSDQREMHTKLWIGYERIPVKRDGG